MGIYNRAFDFVRSLNRLGWCINEHMVDKFTQFAEAEIARHEANKPLPTKVSEIAVDRKFGDPPPRDLAARMAEDYLSKKVDWQTFLQKYKLDVSWGDSVLAAAFREYAKRVNQTEPVKEPVKEHAYLCQQWQSRGGNSCLCRPGRAIPCDDPKNPPLTRDIGNGWPSRANGHATWCRAQCRPHVNCGECIRLKTVTKQG
jgi:hypothetical protein